MDASRNRSKLHLRMGLLVLLAGTACGATVAHADYKPPVAMLEDAALDNLRGGFLLDGIEIAIGLEQIIAIDGETQVINQIYIPNLNQASPGISRHTIQQFDTELLVATKLTQGSGIFTQIQNSLDHTLIQNIHSLNIEISNIGRLNVINPSLGSYLLLLPGR